MTAVSTHMAAPPSVSSLSYVQTGLTRTLNIGDPKFGRYYIVKEDYNYIDTINDITYQGTTSKTPVSDSVVTQMAEVDAEAKRPAHWRRDGVTIGTLDDSLTISVPEDPVGTGVDNKAVPTASAASPVETPATAGDASDDPPEGGDLDKITDKTCKKVCTKGAGGGDITVWDNYSTTHNGTHVTTNHTIIYCDGDCIAHVRSTTTDVDSADSEDGPTTAVKSAAATGAASAAAGSAAPSGSAAPAGSAKLVY